MPLFENCGHSVFSKDLLVAVLICETGGALDPEICCDITEHDSVKSPSPKLEIEIGAVKCPSLFLSDHDIFWSR